MRAPKLTLRMILKFYWDSLFAKRTERLQMSQVDDGAQAWRVVDVERCLPECAVRKLLVLHQEGEGHDR